MDITKSVSACPITDTDSDSVYSEHMEYTTNSSEIPPSSPKLMVARAQCGQISLQFAKKDSTDLEAPASHTTSNQCFSDSEESEPPQYHRLKTVSHPQKYPVIYSDGAAVEDSSPLPSSLPANVPPRRLFHKQEEASYAATGISDSYRSIQEALFFPRSHSEKDFSRKEIVHEISERMSEAYLRTLRYCGIPVVVKPQKAAVYTISVLIIFNALSLILSWAALFSVDPSPTIITYSLTILLGVSWVPSFFVFCAHKFNPFASISAYASTAFSGTFVAGLLEAFFVSNNIEAFEDMKMVALASAAAAFDIMAAVLWLFVIIMVLVFYAVDSQQRGQYVIRFIAFNALAILALVSFLLTLLTDMAFFDKIGQIDIMYLAVGFNLLSVLFSLCFCFCIGFALKEQESEDRDEWSKFVIFQPFIVSAILAIWAFISGILSMVIGTNLSHDPEYSEAYGGSVAALAYLVGTFNFGVALATILVGCILGVHLFM